MSTDEIGVREATIVGRYTINKLLAGEQVHSGPVLLIPDSDLMNGRDPDATPDASGAIHAATFLFDLLDEIDTASDRAKGDDKFYREIVERIQRRRFEVAATDGYSLTFKAPALPAEASDGIAAARPLGIGQREEGGCRDADQ